MDTLSSHFYDAVCHWLEQKQLGKALEAIRNQLDDIHDWSIAQEYESLCVNYRLLLSYFYQGADDPQRQQHYNGFLQQGFALADKIRLCYIRQHTHTEYARLQQRIHTEGKIHHNFQQWTQGQQEIATHFDSLQEMFDAIWTWTETTAAERQHLRQLLSSEESLPIARSLAVSALTLSTISYFDSNKLSLLADFATHSDTSVRVRATIGLVLNLLVYHKRLPFYPDVQEQLRHLDQTTTWQSNLFYIQQCLIGIINAPAIEKKLTEDILPHLKSESHSGHPFHIHIKTDDESESSSVDDKFKEICDMYESNIDVEFHSFAHMKHYPFFQKTANWFIPFSPANPVIPSSCSEAGSPLSFVINSNRLCDSDIHSLCFLMDNVSHTPGFSLSRHLKQIQKELEAELLPTERQERTEQESIKAYIGDCRRYFQLASGKATSTNPFNGPLLLLHYPVLASSMQNKEQLVKLAYIAHKQHSSETVIDIMSFVDHHYSLDKDCLQLYGYHLQQQHQYEQAILCYEKASLLDNDSIWTMRHLGRCYLKTGSVHKATIVYARLYHLLPDDKNIILRYGEALFKENKYEKAITLFQKLEYLDAHSVKAIQAIAYCSLKIFNAPQSYRYYRKMTASHMQAEDYRNAGHAAWCAGDFKAAVEYYRLSAESGAITFTPKDLDILASYGICQEDALLAEDYINHLPN